MTYSVILVLTLGIIGVCSTNQRSTTHFSALNSATLDYEMSQISEYSLGGSFNARGLHIVGDYAYIVGGGRLLILDVSNPVNPTHVGNVTTTVGLWGDVHVVGDYACIGGTSTDFTIVNISDPVNPTVLDQITEGALAWGIFAEGNYAFVASESAGLEVINFTDPLNVNEVTDYDDGLGLPYDVQVIGDYAYVADWNYGLEVLDISDPTALSQVAQVANGSDQAWGIYVSGNYAYIADWGLGLRIFDISTPSSPVELWNGGQNSGEDVWVAGDFAFLVDRVSGLLHVYDVHNKLGPYLTATFSLGEPACDVEVHGDYVYVLGEGMFRILEGEVIIHSYTITSPTSSTSWVPNATEEITWTSTGAVSSIVNIDLFRYDTFLQNIVTDTANNGSFLWLIPLELADSDQYQIKITDSSDITASGMSSYFEIETPQEKKRIPGFSIPFLLGLLGIGIYLLVYRIKHNKE